MNEIHYVGLQSENSLTSPKLQISKNSPVSVLLQSEGHILNYSTGLQTDQTYFDYKSELQMLCRYLHYTIFKRHYLLKRQLHVGPL